MSCDEIRCLIDSYAEIYSDERASTRRFHELLEDYPNCFERACFTPGHLTGSAWVVDGKGARTLLTHHRKLGRWLQLGGHCDGDTDIVRVAAREAREESGVDGLELVFDGVFDLDIHEIPARKGDPAHLHYDVRFAFRATGSEDYTVSGESYDLAWVEMERIPEYTTEESMLRMVRKWLRRPWTKS